ncbi:MAG: DUF1566 domain-containing protein [Deltaproteobacteria bacterium]|nr:DUF1566 domain-containing protein [Deltaproteobacteria bacterium]
MDRTKIAATGLAACAVLGVTLGCSGGISLAGDGDREVVHGEVSTSDAGEDGTCRPHERCTEGDPNCITDLSCQACSHEAWVFRASNCWCTDGARVCDHLDCRPPYAGTYSDPECTVRRGADGDADADADADGDGGPRCNPAVCASACVSVGYESGSCIGDGCYCNPFPDTDADADADADVSECIPPCPSGLTCYHGVCVPSSADADADADADPDADAGSDADGGTCAGGWMDDTSDLCWQHPAELSGRSWDAAVTYCDGLVLGGHDDWHLPTITEMRSLIRGCPATVVTSLDCGVSDWCVPCGTTPCEGCGYIGGPGEGGCYWDDALGADCEYLPFWTAAATDDGRAWYVYFSYAALFRWETTHALRVRCVRPGP